MSLWLLEGAALLSRILHQQTFPPGTSVRTTGPDDEWTMDDNGRMYLNGIPTNLHSGQRNDTPRETKVFQTPPPTPRQAHVEQEDDHSFT